MRNYAYKECESIPAIKVVDKPQCSGKIRRELKGYCKYISLIWVIFVAFVLPVVIECRELGQALAGILMMAAVLQMLGW